MAVHTQVAVQHSPVMLDENLAVSPATVEVVTVEVACVTRWRGPHTHN